MLSNILLDEAIDGCGIVTVIGLVVVLAELHPLLGHLVSAHLCGGQLQTIALDSHLVAIVRHQLGDKLPLLIPHAHQGVFLTATMISYRVPLF